MDEPLEELYFNWLCAKVKDDMTPNYVALLRILHKTEFFWTVTGDMNRVEDGLEIRMEFVNELGVEYPEGWLGPPCSILEFLIAFSRRAWFQTDIPSKEWFWQFITNLRLEDYNRVSQRDEATIKDILDRFVWRTYRSNGQGGLFPLRRPSQDQRKVEIWYQFHEYLTDHGLVSDL